MSKSAPRTTAVIVNYRTASLCMDAVASLAAERGDGMDIDVVAVDSCSRDGSAEHMRARVDTEGWGDWVTVVALAENGGFAAGNNAGLSLVLARDERPDYILLLNPDTVVDRGALGTLVGWLEERPEVGIVGCRLEYPDGVVQSRAFRFPSLMSELECSLGIGLVSRLLRRWVVAPTPPVVSTDTDWVSGACMLVRREVFDDIGLMDDGYFLYFEEVDFCLAARRRSWRCSYVPDARVIHYHGQSTGLGLAAERKRIPRFWFDSRRRYFVKNHGLRYALCADLMRTAGMGCSHALRRLLGRPDPDPPHFFSDFLRSSIVLSPGAGRLRDPA